MSQPSSTPPTSWCERIFEQLVAATDWSRAGDLFNAVEQDIPLHLATRFCARLRHDEATTRSATTARWRLFINRLGSIGVEWEPGGHRHNRHFAERVRLRTLGSCPSCGGDMLKAGWAGGSLKCKVCGMVRRPASGRVVVMSETKPDQPPAPLPPPPEPTHPLIGYRVEQLDARGGVRLRGGVIERVFPSSNSQFGDIALVALRDSSKVLIVGVAAIASNPDIWTLRRPAAESNDERTSRVFEINARKGT